MALIYNLFLNINTGKMGKVINEKVKKLNYDNFILK